MSKKVLAGDLEEEDRILLNRPKVEVMKIEPISDYFSQSPKGRVLHVRNVEGPFKGSVDKILMLDEDKVDRCSTKGWWERWFGKKRVKAQQALVGGLDLIPGPLKPKGITPS